MSRAATSKPGADAKSHAPPGIVPVGSSSLFRGGGWAYGLRTRKLRRFDRGLQDRFYSLPSNVSS